MNSRNTTYKITKAEVKHFFNRSPIRAIISAIADIGIAVYTAVFLTWDSGWKWLGLFILIVVDIVIIGYYAAQTANSNAAIHDLENELEYDDNLIANMDRSCELTIDQSSLVIKKALDASGVLSLHDWNFRMSCKTVIHKLWTQLTKYKEGLPNSFELCYDRVTVVDNRRILETIACYTSDESDPTIKEKEREVSLGGYYDAEYIFNGHSEIECLMSNAEVQAKFADRPKINGAMPHLDQYNQVFIVPVLNCKTDLVGLLIISCLGDTVLGDDPKKVKCFIQSKIGPFLRLLLVFHRLEEVFVLKEIKEENNVKVQKATQKKVYS